MEVSGDISQGEGELDFDISGFGPLVGNFAIQQSMEWSTGDMKEMKIKGNTETEEGWLTELGVSPINTDVKLDWNDKDWIFNGHIINVFDGERFEILLDKNSVEINV